MMTNQLIAFVGPLQSGKTTAARHLVERYNFSRHRFAGAFKLMLKVGFGLTDEEIDGALKHTPTDKLCGRTPRYAMRTMGDWGRDMNIDLWVHVWQNTRPPGPVVCDDLRLPNEYAMLREQKAQIIRVTRPGFEHSDVHESEVHRLPHDEEILNDGTLEELCEKVDALVKFPAF